MRDTTRHPALRSFFWITAACLLAASAQAAPLFADNFDNSFPGEPALISTIWPTWPEAVDHLNTSLCCYYTNYNHTLGGTASQRDDETYHYTLANYTDFGPVAVGVSATAWLWDDLEFKYGVPTGVQPYPVNVFIGLFGDSPTGPTNRTDYLLLGLDPTFPNNNIYGYRTLTGGNGTSSITRSNAVAGSVDGSGWIKLNIQADSLMKGGQVRFYINDALVGTSYRKPGVSLRYFFMGGLNIGGGLTSNYETWWIDDVVIEATPEITGITDAGGTVTIGFISGTEDQATNFTLVSSSSLDGGFAPAAGATISGTNGAYQATVPTSGAVQFYRIQR